MRAFTLWLVDLVLRIFFRHVEQVGRENIPEAAGVVYVANHPNALVDPLFLLALPPEPASFLAKEPLFRMPLVGTFARALRCLPVYRSRDGHDTSANRKSLEAARKLLEAGGAIGIFPEGTSHSDSQLKPFKTGAARIALGAAAESERPVYVVPCALHYTDKMTFRSQAAIVYGEAIVVERVVLDGASEPPIEAAHALTGKIREALDSLVVQAEQPDVLRLLQGAGQVVEGARVELGEPSLPSLGGGEDAGPVERSWRLSRRLVDGYAELSARSPEQVLPVLRRLIALEQVAQIHGVDLAAPLRPDAPRATGVWMQHVFLPLLATPVAVLAVALHYPVYRLVGSIALRTSKDETDVVATAKILLAMLGFPVLWIAAAAFFAFKLTAVAGLGVLVIMPLLSLLALWWSERLDSISGWLAQRRWASRNRGTVEAIRAERQSVYEALLELDSLLPE